MSFGANEKIRSKIDELNKERNEINNLLASTASPINIKKEIRIWLNKIKNNNLELNKKEFIQLLVRKVVVSREEVQIFFNIFARPSNTNAPAKGATKPSSISFCWSFDFNPRTREGCDCIF